MEKLIIINGIQRGGTNVVWNILQSHPYMVSPISETGEVIYPSYMKTGLLRHGKKVLRFLMCIRFPLLLHYAEQRLYKAKLKTLTNKQNLYKYEDVTYSMEEVNESQLVTKSVGMDVFLTPAFCRFFVNTKVIAVVRNGLAVCEGWMRRGSSLEKAAKSYNKIMKEIIRQSESIENYMLVRFEDILKDPLQTISQLFSHVGFDFADVPKLRLKSKPILHNDGEHAVVFGKKDHKQWIDKTDLNSHFDFEVNSRQVKRLSAEQQTKLLNRIGTIMKRLGYDV